MPEVLVYGSGALACLFAYRLVQAGLAVALLDRWQEGVTAIQTYGIRHENDVQHVRASSLPTDFSNLPLAIVLVKTWQTEQAATDLAACLAPDGLALTLQNGLGNREILSHKLGPQRVSAGSTTYGATLLAPGVFRSGGEGSVALSTHLQTSRLAAALRPAGLQLTFTPNLRGLLWEKLIINAAVNPLTALLEVANGQLLTYPHAWQLVVSAVREAAAVAEAQGIVLPSSAPLAETKAVLQRTAGNHSSMLQDMQRGAPTEIDAITGALLAAARAYHLHLPTHEVLYALIKAKIAARQAQS